MTDLNAVVPGGSGGDADRWAFTQDRPCVVISGGGGGSETPTEKRKLPVITPITVHGPVTVAQIEALIETLALRSDVTLVVEK